MTLIRTGNQIALVDIFFGDNSPVTLRQVFIHDLHPDWKPDRISRYFFRG